MEVARRGTVSLEHDRGQIVLQTEIPHPVASGWSSPIRGACQGSNAVTSTPSRRAAGRSLLRCQTTRCSDQSANDRPPENSQLDRMPVHSTAIGAVQIREDHLTMIFLQLGMQPTDAFIHSAGSRYLLHGQS